MNRDNHNDAEGQSDVQTRVDFLRFLEERHFTRSTFAWRFHLALWAGMLVATTVLVDLANSPPSPLKELQAWLKWLGLVLIGALVVANIIWLRWFHNRNDSPERTTAREGIRELATGFGWRYEATEAESRMLGAAETLVHWLRHPFDTNRRANTPLRWAQIAELSVTVFIAAFTAMIWIKVTG